MLVTQDKGSPNPAPKKKGKGSVPQRASTKDWRRTPIKTRPTRPTRMEFYPNRLGVYARELDMYVNRLERDAEKESKKRSEALKAELQAAFDGKLKNSQKKRVRYSTLLDQPSSSKCSTGTVSDRPNMPRRVIVEKVPPFRPIWLSQITHNASPWVLSVG